MGDTEQENDYVLAFDHFYTNNHIQILKALLPYMDIKNMPMLPVMIKYLELKYTLSLVQNGKSPLNQFYSASNSEHGQDIFMSASVNAPPELEQIYQSIKKYLTPNEEKVFSQLMQMKRTMNQAKEMQQMMEMFQNMNIDSDSMANGFPDMSMFENMLGNNKDFSDIMQLFKSM